MVSLARNAKLATPLGNEPGPAPSQMARAEPEIAGNLGPGGVAVSRDLRALLDGAPCTVRPGAMYTGIRAPRPSCDDRAKR